jgi:PAS domain S-box-containing protein
LLGVLPVTAVVDTLSSQEEHDGGRMSAPSPLVLVFDRDAGTRAWYRAAFISTDYRVAEAADGTEAVEFLTSQLPDLIISELRTHHRDGLTLCVIKRSNAATADIPILLMTLNGDHDVEVAARLVGASALLARPHSPTAVLAAARRMILATPQADVRRRRLYRTLADLREEANAQAPQSAAIEEQARQLLTAVASALSSVMLANDEAKCVAVNAAACHLTGYSEAELLARSVWDLARPDAHQHARMRWGRFLVNGECAGEFLMVQKDGAEVTIQVCAMANIAPGLHATVVDREPIEA